MTNTLSFAAISAWPACGFTLQHKNMPASHVPTLLGKIRQQQPIQRLSHDHPDLTNEQLSLVQSIQAQDAGLSQMYHTLQAAEAYKAELERELIHSLCGSQPL
jgi:outer membrane lipopolysaccharide assembly protein LptE/RlpB